VLYVIANVSSVASELGLKRQLAINISLIGGYANGLALQIANVILDIPAAALTVRIIDGNGFGSCFKCTLKLTLN